jgi:hypothetical protein
MKISLYTLLACIFLLGCGNEGSDLKNLERESSAYLWRESYDEGVRRTLCQAAKDFDCINFLAAKISFDEASKKPRLKMTGVNASYFQNLDVRLAASVRIEGLLADSKTYRSLAPEIAGLVASAVSEVISKGIGISEIQIDYDCPESKIADYALWMSSIRSALPENLKLSFTALPSQMNARGFSKLAANADSFTLQVHHFAERSGAYSIFDSQASLQAARKASKFKRPFNVALPTYSHIAIFDRQSGRLKRAYSENFSGGVNHDTEIGRFVNSDPSEVSALAIALKASDLKNCTGVIFYRIPCSDELTNWAYDTLIKVKSGEKVFTQISVSVVENGKGLFEVFITNGGTAAAYPPFEFRIEEKEPAFMDSAKGFSAKRDGIHLVFSAPEESIIKLTPGAKLKIGCFRKK